MRFALVAAALSIAACVSKTEPLGPGVSPPRDAGSAPAPDASLVETDAGAADAAAPDASRRDDATSPDASQPADAGAADAACAWHVELGREVAFPGAGQDVADRPVRVVPTTGGAVAAWRSAGAIHAARITAEGARSHDFEMPADGGAGFALVAAGGHPILLWTVRGPSGVRLQRMVPDPTVSAIWSSDRFTALSSFAAAARGDDLALVVREVTAQGDARAWRVNLPFAADERVEPLDFDPGEAFAIALGTDGLGILWRSQDVLQLRLPGTRQITLRDDRYTMTSRFELHWLSAGRWLVAASDFGDRRASVHGFVVGNGVVDRVVQPYAGGVLDFGASAAWDGTRFGFAWPDFRDHINGGNYYTPRNLYFTELGVDLLPLEPDPDGRYPDARLTAEATLERGDVTLPSVAPLGGGRWAVAYYRAGDRSAHVTGGALGSCPRVLDHPSQMR